MYSVIVSVEGYSLPDGYVIKELTIMSMSGDYTHVTFKPPPMPLSPVDQRTIDYACRYLNGLFWEEGLLPYTMLPGILETLRGAELICHGVMASTWLKKVCPNSRIRDTSTQQQKFPRTIPFWTSCGKNHNTRYCSLHKAHYILNNFV